MGPDEQELGERTRDAHNFLDLLRRRRDHLRTVYFQQESRAQIVFGFAVGVGGALIGSIAGHLGFLLEKAGAVFWILLVISGGLLILTFLLALCSIVPLAGRHLLRSGSVVDRWVTALGFWASGMASEHRTFGRKPGPDSLADFAADFLHVDPPPDAKREPALYPILIAEIYNVWALWTATSRKAGLLRLAVLLLAAGLLFALPVYLLGQEILPPT